ncbi:MAG: ECF transporter S component [Promethearchaeota archaeon]
MELESEVKEASEEVEVIDIEHERANHSIWLDKSSFRIALVGTFTALATVLGYLLYEIPNIELFTLTIFLSGFILGKRDGMIVGFISSLIFCFFNPYGTYLPLLAFQLTHYTLTGLVGAFTKQFLRDRKIFRDKKEFYTVSLMIFFGSLGFTITTSFQVFASLVDVLVSYGTIEAFVPYFFNPAAFLFTIVHLVGNTLGFIFVLPGLIQLINKILY